MSGKRKPVLRIWQVDERRGKLYVPGARRLISAYSREQAKELYAEHHKQHDDTSISAVVAKNSGKGVA